MHRVCEVADRVAFREQRTAQCRVKIEFALALLVGLEIGITAVVELDRRAGKARYGGRCVSPCAEYLGELAVQYPFREGHADFAELQGLDVAERQVPWETKASQRHLAGSAPTGRAGQSAKSKAGSGSAVPVPGVSVSGAAFLIGFRPHAGPLDWIAAGGDLLMFIVAFSWMSAAVGLLAKTPEGTSGFTFFVTFLPYASSAFVPIDTMPSWIRGFAKNQPVTPVTESIRSLLLNQPVGSRGWRWLGAAGSWPSRSCFRRCCSGGGLLSLDPPLILGDVRPRR
jgi:hypothetical protein